MRPTSKDLQQRLASFWLPDQPVVYIGSTTGSVAGRIAAIVKTVPGDAKPAASGLWLHFLRNPGDLRVWWAATDAPEEYEDALLEAFAAGITDADRAAVGKGVRGRGRERAAVGRPPVTVGDPQGDGDRQPAAGRGQAARAQGRVADRGVSGRPRPTAPGTRRSGLAARRPAGAWAGWRRPPAYAAQGSPRKPPPEPVLVSAEGLERLQAELAGLLAERPGVIKRIATAREHGDLKENAEYHAAREEQGFLEGRIKALEAKLKVAQVVAPTERGARVELGSHVTRRGRRRRVDAPGRRLGRGEQPRGPDLSVSPVGAALMGRRVGDAVTIVTPGGEIRYKVLAID